jgi:hypothetical protein
VTVHPSHLKSLQHLVKLIAMYFLMDFNILYFIFLIQGLMYHYLGSHRLAEKTLRDAAKINPYSPETWYVWV